MCTIYGLVLFNKEGNDRSMLFETKEQRDKYISVNADMFIQYRLFEYEVSNKLAELDIGNCHIYLPPKK